MKLLAVDMDGTCLNSQKILPQETLDALKNAAAAGWLVVPATGRPLHWLPKALQQWNKYRYAITSNGAKVLDRQATRLLLDRCMAPETAIQILDNCKGHGLGLTAHIMNDYFLQGLLLILLGRRSFREDASGFRYCRSLVHMIRRQSLPVEELQIFFMKKENRAILENILAENPNLSVSWDRDYVEIMAAGVSKGAALSVLADHLGIPKKDIACVGDNENDLSMFDAAGLRFAMGNAVPLLKEQADIVLPSNDENGVCHAVKHLLC